MKIKFYSIIILTAMAFAMVGCAGPSMRDYRMRDMREEFSNIGGIEVYDTTIPTRTDIGHAGVGTNRMPVPVAGYQTAFGGDVLAVSNGARISDSGLDPNSREYGVYMTQLAMERERMAVENRIALEQSAALARRRNAETEEGIRNSRLRRAGWVLDTARDIAGF